MKGRGNRRTLQIAARVEMIKRRNETYLIPVEGRKCEEGLSRQAAQTSFSKLEKGI
ncbi:MAG: hypothetical protein U0T74_07575 [Chitinophagales bacterium]